MRIAFFSDTFYPQINGVVTSITNSSKFLASEGHEMILFVPKSKACIKIAKNVQIEQIHSVGLPTYKDYRIAMPQTIKCLRKIHQFKPDIIHIHSPFPIGMLGVMCSKTFGIPLIGTYHTLFPEFLKYLPIPLLRENRLAKGMTWRYTNFVYNKCEIITTPSNAMKKELITHGIRRPIRVISNGVNMAAFHKLASNKARKKTFNLKNRYLLHFGRLSYEKNIEIVLKSFRLLLQKYPNYDLVIAGKGPCLANLKKEAKSLGIHKNVRFTGFVSDDRLIELISRADAFATASTIETQGLATLEAMACGLPVIGVDSRATPELIQNGKNGFLVKPGDYRTMGICLAKLASNPKLRTKMSGASLKMAKKHSLEKVISELEGIYFGQIKSNSHKR